MKRFVTYLYLYDGRMKGNNAGFIKVEINGEKSAFLVQIKISEILRKRKSVSGI